MSAEELRVHIHALRNELKCERRDVGHDLHRFWPRATWLIGLLFFQSTSSFVLQSFGDIIQEHATLMYFLTMLVGAGGNAGSQSVVIVIRDLAKAHGHARVMSWKIVVTQFWMATRMAFVLAFVSYIRCHIMQGVAVQESIAISTSMLIIVFFSMLLGSLLPVLLLLLNIDPGHAGAAIQVIMDILGVTMTCLVGAALPRDHKIIVHAKTADFHPRSTVFQSESS